MLTYHNNVVDFLGILTNYKHRIVNDNKKRLKRFVFDKIPKKVNIQTSQNWQQHKKKHNSSRKLCM